MSEKHPLAFERLFPGIYKAHAGEGGLSLTQYYKAAPRADRLNARPERELPFTGAAWERVGERLVILLPRALSEKLYGLGLNYQQLDVTHEARQLRADHYGGRDNGRTHVPAPLYVSDAGYAVLVDTPMPVSFYMGGTVRKDAAHPPRAVHRMREEGWSADTPAELVEASFCGPGCDILVFAGAPGPACMRSAVSAVNLWAGGGFIPPKWGLGMVHRVHAQAREQDVLDEVESFAAHDMPLSVIGMEPGWQSAAYPCSQEWDTRFFPEPEGFAAALHEKGIRLNLWENFYLSEKSPLYGAMLPHTGSHKVWNGIVPDLADPEAVRLLSAHHASLVSRGADGFKVDECDGYDRWLWPDHAEFPSGVPAPAMRALYGAALQRMQTEVFRAADRRTYGLVRASNAGASSMPYVIYNDCYDFPQFLTGTASAAFCGTLWVPEVRDAASAGEWVRRFQLSAVSPLLMLNAWASGTKPWSFPEVEEEIRAILRFRESFRPVLYNAFRAYYEEGIPPFRPLIMDHGGLGSSTRAGALDGTANPYSRDRVSEVTDELLIGESVLAAPVSPESNTRHVLLPEGDWYDYFTFKRVENEFTRTFALHEMPLYVRGGTALPTLEGDTLVLRCYGASGTGTVYDDDGETFAYERGVYAELSAEFEHGEGTCTIAEHGCTPAWKAVRFRFTPET